MTKTPQGEDIVILARSEYDRLVAAAGEDARDAATARSVIARLDAGDERMITSAEMDELLAAKTPLSFYRKRAGLTQAGLAERVGVAQGFLSEIENGTKTGDVKTLRRLADALKVSLDDIVVAEMPIEDVARKRKAS